MKASHYPRDYSVRVIEQIEESIEVKRLLKREAVKISQCAQIITSALGKNGKIIIFGNGGSAADAQHIAAEFVGKYMLDRKAYSALALTVNTSSLTAIANDYGFEHIFERQIQAVCGKNDVAIGISTSGNSKNVLLGIQAANEKGAFTIGLTGKKKPNILARSVDIAISVPSESTPRIQECHILIGHVISYLVEQALTGR